MLTSIRGRASTAASHKTHAFGSASLWLPQVGLVARVKSVRRTESAAAFSASRASRPQRYSIYSLLRHLLISMRHVRAREPLRRTRPRRVAAQQTGSASAEERQRRQPHQSLDSTMENTRRKQHPTHCESSSLHLRIRRPFCHPPPCGAAVATLGEQAAVSRIIRLLPRCAACTNRCPLWLTAACSENAGLPRHSHAQSVARSVVSVSATTYAQCPLQLVRKAIVRWPTAAP